MVRTVFMSYVGGSEANVQYVRLAGNSSDTKPTENIATGSVFREVDTGKAYRFNESTGQWTESSIDDEEEF